MKKDLPNIYANPIDKAFNNNTEVYYSTNDFRGKKNIDVNKKINEIFASRSHVYKSNVKITTSKGLINTVIVGKTTNALLTLDGTRININDVLDIEKV